MADARPKPRPRVPTEKGMEYQVGQKQKQFFQQERRVRESVAELQTIVITTNSVNSLQEQVKLLVEQNTILQELHDSIVEYVTDEELEKISSKLQCCNEAIFDVKKTATERITELRRHNNKATSIASHSLISTSSARQQRLQLAEKAAALKVELEFEEEERMLEDKVLQEELKIKMMRIEQERAKRKLTLTRELAKNKAQIDVCVRAEREEQNEIGIDNDIKSIPPVDKDRDMERFLNSNRGSSTDPQSAPVPMVRTERDSVYTWNSDEHINPWKADDTLQEVPVTNQQVELNAAAEAFEPQLLNKRTLPASPLCRCYDNMASQPDPMMNMMKQLVDSFRLPQVKVEVFNGEPMKFPMWETAFNALIESKAASFNEKLNLLSQHLSGEPKSMVSNYLLLQTEEAYKKAKAELKERYGNNTVIAKAFLSKLNSWPKLPRDPLELRKLSDFINEVTAAKKRVPDLKVLDFPQENAKLINKLPYHIENKWRSVVQRHLNDGSFPTFETFAEFLALRAKEANIPIFEPVSQGKEEHQSWSQTDRAQYVKGKKRGVTSFATNVDDRITKDALNTSCPFCKTTHHIDDCDGFKKLPRKERKQFLIKENLCFACGMSSDHRRYECKSKVKCSICTYEHLTCLHYDKGKKQSVSHCTIVCNDQAKCTDNSMIIPVWVRSTKNPSNEFLQYCVLDPQSNTCFISEELQQKLGVPGHSTKLSLSTMHASSVVSSERIRDLEILSFDRKVTIQLPSVYTRNSVPAERDQIPRPDVANKWEHLKVVANEIVPYMAHVDVGLLIGNNVPSAVRPRDIVAGKDEHPYGQRSILGWGIIGMVCQDSTTRQVKAVSNRISATDETHHRACTSNTHDYHKNRLVHPKVVKEIVNPQQINRMFEIEFIEQKSKYEAISVEDRRFLKLLEDNVQHREDGHYEMPLPLRSDDVSLPNNKALALKRLMQQKRRFNRDEKYKSDYLEFMNDMILHCAERVPDESLKVQDGKVNYVPHTGVYHPKKQKIRVVFDCSAEFRGVSLNDYLLQGPDLLNGLVGVLARFRKEKIALIADIKGMFHQFFVREEDRDLLRFLWWKDCTRMEDVVEYRMKVHIFGAGSSPACANFGLKLAANDGEKEFGEAAANFVRNDFYVDDGLKSVPTVQEACDLIKSSTALCAKAGLKLHKWTSNNREVLNSIPEEDRASDLKEININADPLPIGRVLGVTWCIESDCFQFRVQLTDHPLTRRGVLATVSSIYDPIGFAAPVLMVGKMILQELCKSCVDWDEPIPDQLKQKWESWRRELLNLEHLTYKRCFKPATFDKVKDVEIHYFSDASDTGYGQCTYIRQISEEGKTHCSFAIGKARVTPAKKKFTIPRLELTAAVISAKMSDFVKRELHYENAKEFFWTDSKVVLGYVNNEAKRFQVYVANRIQQIRDLTSPESWRYVDTESNPSDDASRGLSAQQLTADSRWLNGPQFLWKNGPCKYACGTFHADPETEIEVTKEMKKCKTFKTVTEESLPKAYVESKQIERFSTWYHATRAIANCLRFAAKWRRITKASKRGVALEKQNPTQLKMLSVEELQEGERAILKGLQQEHFEEEINILQSLNVMGDCSNRQARERNRNLKKTSSIYRLDPFLDGNDIIRVGGRIRRANLQWEVRHPILLPKKNHTTNLVIRQYHREVNHMGRTTTHNHIRQNGYWVINGSSAVSQYINRCVVCKKMRGSLLTQKMADLPTDRMEQEPPFTYCAVDFFGPFKIKERRSEVKRYGVLFTCMSSRSIHLETANSLETDSFINALRRFLNLRGPAKQIRSDCGTNLVGANNMMKKMLMEIDQKKVGEFLLRQHCDWLEFKFNVPSASHMGGVWERLIRTVRSALEPIMNECGSQLDDESFRTLISEVQGIVNSRPLTVDNLSDPNAPAPLTPNNLLTMKTKVLLPPPGNFQRADLYCRQRWRRVQHIANEFWQRWRKEFLQTLQPRKKWIKSQRNVRIGDIVIIKDDNLPRNLWKIAKVDTVYPSEDGVVRKVKLMIGSRNLDDDGTRHQLLSYLERPIHKLVILVHADGDD